MWKRLALVLLLAAGAQAQTLDMDMSWGLQVQQNAWDYGQQASWQAAQNYYNQVQAYRAATGYTGLMPAPVSQAQLQSSIQQMNNAWNSYNQLPGLAPSRYAEEAIMGQTMWVNPATGQQYWLPTQYGNYGVTPNGTVYGW